MRRLPTSALAAILIAASLLAAPGARAEEELRSVSLEALQGKLETQALHLVGPNGLEISVDGNTSVTLPLNAQVLELDVEVSGPVLLTWAARSPGRTFRPFGPPWRHVTLPRQRERVRLDLRITDGWTPAARPTLGLTGAAVVIIHGIRVLPIARDPDDLLAAVDRAQRWAPEAIGHTTINFLTPSYWSYVNGTWLADVVAIAGAAAFAVVLAAGWALRRRLLAARALAAGCLVAAGLWDVHLLARFLPAFHLRPTLDVEERIRDHYDLAPDVGALAALARATIPPGERVGVMASQGNWFAPQTICFNLAPRPCVVLTSLVPVAEHRGISQVGYLSDDQLDAIVAHRVAPLPPGFTPVAAIGKSAVVARRRP